MSEVENFFTDGEAYERRMGRWSRIECTNRFDYWIPALARRAKARLARPE
jgi:hypothetical protein